MHLPSSYVAAGPATATPSFTSLNVDFWMFKGRGGYPENWSSLIGIITAIVGNVLISFALNMQRYAHIRLDREWQEKERQRKKRNASSTSLAKLVENGGNKDSKRKYHSPRQSEDSNGHARPSEDAGYEASESDPLIPQSPSRSRSRPSLESQDSSGSGQEAAYKQQSYLKSPYWWLGIILMTIGEAGNFLAYGFAPASIVSPLGVVALISNCIIAPFMLKEPFRKRDILGVIIAVGGAVTVVLSAKASNPKLGPDEIWDLIRRWEFETYLGITVGVIVILMVASNRYGEKNILIDLGLVGLFGGYTALSTKGVSSLLSYTLWRAITFPVFYLLVAILVGTAIMQIKYVNRALQRFDATQVIPVQFVLFTLSVIGGSAVLYRDFERTSGEDAGKFVGGCALTFFGVWLITSGRPSHHDEDEEDREPEPEDAINLIEERYRDDVGGISDNAGGSTRQTSTMRSTSPPVNIQQHYRDDDGSRPSTPNIKFTPETSTPRPHGDRGTSANILASIDANPWIQQNEPENRIPPFSRHTSTPVLPSEAAPAPLATRSDPELPLPQTPTRGKSHDEVPTTPGTAQSQLRRLRTNERIGRSNIQGPLLASPLSTTLSAMVQDMKRGGNIRTREVDGSVRRRESVLGIGASEVDSGSMGEPLGRRRTHNSEVPSEQAVTPSGRGRSLSGTLNDLWNGMRGQSSREDIRGEEANNARPEPGTDGER
ncbi:magnesium transporter NIPA-domain-containing protein [Pyrenochaeta sp. MPI-SDFR-AT-0127]|nr:magnesium transporter NIPA-domain-containing protein [Pyrenochaeta sp. MPI-SDFR-AT-0127]